ncbi:cyclin-dependent kinase 2-interacting protein [Eucyclogobius newberryi]|uniref:cyclin-dependent kinase 2-interacting protein n=1 Tax=Eucyclogobius newberryi TaxID=166745 RepID=UPI003B5939A1
MEGSHRKSAELRGSARKIRDNAADFHNIILRWDRLNDEGLNICTRISNIRSQSHSDPGRLAMGDSVLFQSFSAGGAEELHDECCKLQEIVKKLSSLALKLDRLLDSHSGLSDLDRFRTQGHTLPLFQTWTTAGFESWARSVRTWFRSELDLKNQILQDLAHCQSPDVILVYLSLWIHQPHIPVRTRLGLEGLLLETGHRDL